MPAQVWRLAYPGVAIKRLLLGGGGYLITRYRRDACFVALSARRFIVLLITMYRNSLVAR